MPTGLMIFVLFLFLLAAFLGGVITMDYFSGEGTTVAETLLSWDEFTTKLFGIVPIPWPSAAWLHAFQTAFFYDYAIFEGTVGGIIRAGLLLISAGVSITVITKIIRG